MDIRTVNFFQRWRKYRQKKSTVRMFGGPLPLQQGWLTTTLLQQQLVSSGCRSSRPWMRNPRICGKKELGGNKRKERIASRHDDERERERFWERLGSIVAPLAFCGRTHIHTSYMSRSGPSGKGTARLKGRERKRGGGKGSDQAEAVRNQRNSQIPSFVKIVQEKARRLRRRKRQASAAVRIKVKSTFAKRRRMDE